MANIIEFTNSCYCNIPKKSITGHVLALALHLNVFGAGIQPDGPSCLETPLNGQYNHTQQPLLLQLSKKINPWGCPGSGPTGACRLLPRWSGLEIQDTAPIFGPWGSSWIQQYPTLDPTTTRYLEPGGSCSNIYIDQNQNRSDVGKVSVLELVLKKLVSPAPDAE